MAVGKNKRVSKGGRKGAKKKVVEAMSRKEWYDVIAPSNFKTRQFTKTICNKTQGLKIASENLRGRVFEVNQADLDNSTTKDAPFRKFKFCVQEIQDRNLLTQFHGLELTTDKKRSLIRKWCTTIEAQVEAKTADGYTLRVFLACYTSRHASQLSKNCYCATRLEKWIRFRITKMIQARLIKCDINQAATLFGNDVLIDALYKRCNPIVPIRDLKILKVKTIRAPKFDMAKLMEAHGDVPTSKEADARIVEEATEEVAVAVADE